MTVPLQKDAKRIIIEDPTFDIMMHHDAPVDHEDCNDDNTDASTILWSYSSDSSTESSTFTHLLVPLHQNNNSCEFSNDLLCGISISVY
jgi:hypothetical protein